MKNKITNLKVKPKIDKQLCFHCGEVCEHINVFIEEKYFCCEGCKTVYTLLSDSELCNYYNLDNNSGVKPKNFLNSKWDFLEDENIQKELLQYKSDNLNIITFHIPDMHCASCIYLLENLPKLIKGVVESQTRFTSKQVYVKYNPKVTTLKEVAVALSSIGYAPEISLGTIDRKKQNKTNNRLIYQLGVAGFCFGNIMLFSLPEYFDAKDLLSNSFIHTFRFLNLFLALPVLLYSASDYYLNSFYSLKNKVIHMDVPIMIGISGLSIQSIYDIITSQGGGYFDSVTGLVFMLLIGKFFQNKTYNFLEFERNYKSYFPLTLKKVIEGKEKSVKVSDLKKGDIISVYHNELIPTDCYVLEDEVLIDYSFVTGESNPVSFSKNEVIFSGGKNLNKNVKLIVKEAVEQSYLTRLWNAESFQKNKPKSLLSWQSTIATLFTIGVVVIAAINAIYWSFHNPTLILKTTTSVLIVACPCVLALTIQFTFGHIGRILAKNGLYLKDTEMIENLAGTQVLVFDKTGTITKQTEAKVIYNGEGLKTEEKEATYALLKHSNHPLSKAIIKELKEVSGDEIISNWNETIGLGIEGKTTSGNNFKIEKGKFDNKRGTVLSINGILKGLYTIKYPLRNGLEKTISNLKSQYEVWLLSGDNDEQAQELSPLFGYERMIFKQTPFDKMGFIHSQKQSGKMVTMIGDGLNDAGALQTSNFGITITDDINSFTPSCDAVLDADKISQLPNLIAISKETKKIIYASWIFSLAYNTIGLFFAVQGLLHPLVAALLMPLSSISVVIYTWVATHKAGNKHQLNT